MTWWIRSFIQPIMILHNCSNNRHKLPFFLSPLPFSHSLLFLSLTLSSSFLSSRSSVGSGSYWVSLTTEHSSAGSEGSWVEEMQGRKSSRNKVGKEREEESDRMRLMVSDEVTICSQITSPSLFSLFFLSSFLSSFSLPFYLFSSLSTISIQVIFDQILFVLSFRSSLSFYCTILHWVKLGREKKGREKKEKGENVERKKK